MGRRKASKGMINNRTILNIFGVLLVVGGLIVFLSFWHLLSPDGGGGKWLQKINEFTVSRFGGMFIFIPFIMFLYAGLFFSTKKMKLVKPNVAIGVTFMFTALLGMFHTGDWGKSIWDNFTINITLAGTLIVLFVSFVLGVILFLDTSIDTFIMFLFSSVKATVVFIKDHTFRGLPKGEKKKDKKKNKAQDDDEEEEDEEEFIPDRALENLPKGKPKINMPPVMASAHATANADGKGKGGTSKTANGDFNISPYQGSSSTWVYPPITLLQEVSQKDAERGDVTKNADIIEKTLDSFGVRARVSEVNPGPTVTQYALTIAIGTKLTKITALGNDLALALAAPTGQVRIEAPIPGRSLVGIEIPNIKPQIVTIKSLLSSPVFTESTDPLLVPLGLDVGGKPIATSISKMPHSLIAGTTGSGKSVMLNAWLTTIMFRTKPEEVRLILVDPKRVELTGYNGIPHLLTSVIVEPSEILKALAWTVKEMENRYKQFAEAGVRNLEGYNNIEGIDKKPFIVFVIDELADLMMFAPGEAEDMITRIAQMARATGIHLILATQRPSVDVITGLMKANIPTRLAFNVSTMVDSRVIIDSPGAEKLLGKGDMLFMPPDQAKPRRVQGPFVTEKEVSEVVKFLKSQVPVVHYTEEITNQNVSIGKGGKMTITAQGEDADNDPLFNQAVEVIMQSDKASASLLQRRMKVGYARAARILDELEAAGYIGPSDGSKPREILRRSGAEA